jgi:excisionase family DNA binding protein
MPKKDSSSSSEGRSITKREETTKATRNTTRKNSARKKKRRNPVEELSEKLGLSRSTTYEYLNKRIIPGVRIGHRWILPDDVEDRIKARAYEDWPPPDKKLRRQRKKSSDSQDNS